MVVDVFTFLFSLIIAFSGLLFGLFLSKQADDEVHHYRQFIPFIQLLLFSLFFVLLFIYIPFTYAFVLLLLSFVFLFIFWHKLHINILDYLIFAPLFALSTLLPEFHLYATLVLFLFGIFSGALYYVLHRNHPKKKSSKISFHTHSKKHLSFDQLAEYMFSHYVFFLGISFATYVLAQVIRFLFF